MIKDLWVEESPPPMAVGEAKAFTIDYTDLGTPAAAGTVLAYDAAGVDKSATVLSGAASLAGNIVTLRLFTPASAQTYRLVNTVTISGNTVVGVVDVRVISVTPASGITNGYTTRQEVLDLIRAESTDVLDDAVIDALITQASRWIDRHTGRTFYARTETRLYDVPDYDDDGRTLFLDDDLLTVTTLTNGDLVVLTTADYFLLPRNETPKYAVKLKDVSDKIWEVDSNSSSEGVISLVGTWGFSTTAPADVEQACQLICVQMYRNRFGPNVTGTAIVTGAGVVINPQDIPSSAIALLRAYVRSF
jgi:hypothetical protein